jgi:hypothetical protein
MLALTGLMFCGINNASMIGQEQREVLYALHTLGQNFVDVPMIFQNVDMFMGVLEMNIQVNAARLKVANQKIKETMLTNAGLFVGAAVTRAGIVKFASTFGYPSAYGDIIRNILLNGSYSLGVTVSILNALNIHDAWKNRSALIEAIALDKEILGKLEEVKASMDFIEENADSAGSILLNSAE